MADRVSELLRRASQICRGIPVRVNTNAGKPDLKDTLLFIQEKLNDEASVMYRDDDDLNGQTYSFQESWRVLDAHADISTCQMHYRLINGQGSENRPTDNWNMALSFRRVEKIEVQNEQEFRAQNSARMGWNEKSHQTPAVYRLSIQSPSRVASDKDLMFRDEDTANRVAKAMLHAVELCGGGSSQSKEPL